MGYRTTSAGRQRQPIQILDQYVQVICLRHLLLRSPCDTEHLAKLTFVAAVGAKQAIDECIGQTAKCELKWPNDLMINGLKCGGILLESQMIKSEVLVVIGIGINCEHFPEETLHPSTSLKAAGCAVKAEDLFQKMAETTANCILKSGIVVPVSRAFARPGSRTLLAWDKMLRSTYLEEIR